MGVDEKGEAEGGDGGGGVAGGGGSGNTARARLGFDVNYV